MAQNHTADIHFVPVSVDYDGAADVGAYFRPKEHGTSNDGLLVKEATLRGRRLAGTTIALPEGFTGAVISRRGSDELMERKGSCESSSPSSEGKWRVADTFSKLSFWNHETTPSKMDPMYRCMEWLEMSKKVHSNVTSEEIDQMLRSDMLQN